MSAAVIPDIDDKGFTERLLDLFPPGWAGQAARTKGGILHALMTSIAGQLQYLNDGVIFAWKATRIATAEGSALDAVAKDFFGDEVKRAPGEPDESFRPRVQSSLLLPAATRPAMALRLKRLTGVEPRLMEPWSLLDTAVWGLASYWNVDSNEVPARWGNPTLGYHGFVQTPLPPFSGNASNPAYAMNAGAAWGAWTGVWWKPLPTWFINQKALDSLILNTKVFGTIVARQYRTPGSTVPVSGSTDIPEGSEQYLIVIPPIEGLYSVIAQPSWNTTCWVTNRKASGFTVVFGTPAPEGAVVNWLASPVTAAGTGYFPLLVGADETDFVVPQGLDNYNLIVMPSWNTTRAQVASTQSTRTISWGTSSPSGAPIHFHFFPPGEGSSGIFQVPENAVSVTIPVNAPLPYQAFAMSSWNTVTWVEKENNSLIVSFAVPAPASATVIWAVKTSQ